MKQQAVMLGDRFRVTSYATLLDDEVMNGRRLRIRKGQKIIGCVIFKGTTERDYFNAMQRLSKRIGRRIQYIFLYPPILPREELENERNQQRNTSAENESLMSWDGIARE